MSSRNQMNGSGFAGPANDMATVTPSDGADLTRGPCRALYVVAAGNVSIVTAGGTQQDLTDVPAFTTIPVSVARVRSTGTTATVKALY